MYYALTIKDNIITGVHESMTQFTKNTFQNNPELKEHKVKVIDDLKDYQFGVDIRCYKTNGEQKPLLWCIEQSYLPLPDNMEIINGELINKQITPEEAPPTLMEELRQLRAEVAELKIKTKPLDSLLVDVAEMKQKAKKEEIIVEEPIEISPIKKG